MSTNRVFGPIAPSRLALMGMRFIEGEDGAAPAAPTPAEKTDAPPPADPAQDTTDWKAEARKWESRAKENSTAAQRLAEIEEEKKTDEQKVADRIAAAEQRAADLEIKATRAEVAAAKGIPAELLHGGTKEELEAEADALIAFRGEPAKPSAAPFIENKNKTTIEPDYASAIAEAAKARNFALVATLKQQQAAQKG